MRVSTSRMRAIARRLCDESAVENVIEPLLADLDFELSTAPTERPRIAAQARWWLAFCQSLLFCTGRSLFRRASRPSLDGVLLWTYGIGILLVIGVAPHWVRTGEVSLMASIRGWSRIVPSVPWLFVWQDLASDSRRVSIRQAILRLLLLIPLTALACIVNPVARTSIAAIAAVNFLVSLTAGRWYPRRRRFDHLSIK